MNKLTVGVLMGGKSIEREVSLNSGRTICDHLDTEHYTIVPLFQTITGALYILPERFLHRGKISDFEHRLETEAQKIAWDDLKQLIDFMYIALHGRYAEDGTLQGFLEVLGIPYLGSKVWASALGMDKIVQKKLLQAANIGVAQGYTIYPHENISDALTTLDTNLSYPLVVKPYKEGSSLGVSIVYTYEELLNAIEKAATITAGKRQAVLIEEKMSGMEFSCIVLTDYNTNTPFALPPTEIVPEKNRLFFDYDQKYMPGRATKYTPARCTQAQIHLIQETCIKVMQILGITNIARIDGFLTPDNRIIIIDPNTFSGMGPASFAFLQAAEINMSHTELINHLILTELRLYGIHSPTISAPSLTKNHMIPHIRIRVGVLFGGASAEKEISLESGRNVIYKLSPHKYDALPLFVSSKFELYKLDQKLLVRNSTLEIENHVTEDMKVSWNSLTDMVDFVFIALHGGLGENGSVQGTLEMLGLPYNGSSVLTSALCMDKFKTTEFLRAHHIEAPYNVLLSRKEWYNNQAASLSNIIEKIPTSDYIIKPHNDGCSTLVAKARTSEQLCQAIEAIFETGREYALIEECIKGTELTVGVIGNIQAQALPPSQVVTQADILSLEEKFLPGAGENQTPALLPVIVLEMVKKTMEQAYTILNCKGYVRIDCFYQSAELSPTGADRVIIIEVNTLPGLTPATCIFHQAAEVGIKPMDFIDKIITLGFEEHGQYSTTLRPHLKQLQ